MKKSFQKTLIAASVGAVMMAAVGTASANSLLFPYFTTATGAQSVVSISANANVAATDTLHYVYNYGDSCTHYDGKGKVTPNDLLQHSVASLAAGGFGMVVGSDKSTPFYFPLANSYGFLVVSNVNAANVATGNLDITGDMAIVDPATGLVASYAATSNGAAAEGNFAAITDKNFNLSFYPQPLVDTSWYGVVAGDMNLAIVGGLDWKATATLSNGGKVFDNEENNFSGAVTKKLTCAGKVGPADLMNSAQVAAVGPNGGLIHATTTFDTVAPVGTGIVMSKLQVVKAVVGAPFAGKMFLHRENGAAF